MTLIFFYWRIALILRNVFHIQNMFLNSFPTILRPFEAKVFDEKCQQVTFGQTQKWFQGHFLRILFNFFVHFLQYFHFYASYDPNFFTEGIALTLRNVFHSQNVFLNSFPNILRIWSKSFRRKVSKSDFWTDPKSGLTLSFEVSEFWNFEKILKIRWKTQKRVIFINFFLN